MSERLYGLPVYEWDGHLYVVAAHAPFLELDRPLVLTPVNAPSVPWALGLYASPITQPRDLLRLSVPPDGPGATVTRWARLRMAVLRALRRW